MALDGFVLFILRGSPMARPCCWRKIAWILIPATLILSAMGCQAALTTAMYLIKGTDVDPDFKELKGKTVAVVCRPMAALQYRNANADRELAEQITLLLQQKVPKIKTIDQRKVAKWTDENTWEEYSEVGKAMKADMVVGVDLEGFSLYQGQTLYQGKANATVRVYDCHKEGRVVFEKSLPRVVFPPNSAVATSDRTEPEFRKQFIMVLADQIARHFYAHDPYADLGQDATVLR
jgi:hypothetical protein